MLDQQSTARPVAASRAAEYRPLPETGRGCKIACIPVPDERQTSPNRNSDEFRSYMDEMWRRLRVFSKRSAAVPAEEHGSFEWLSAAGSFWWEARERVGLSREEFAQRLDLPLNQVRFLEFGLVTPQELSERRLRQYARALDEPDLYEQFLRRFES